MSISVSEIVLVLVVAVLCIKPEKLPDTARKLGQWLRWLRQATQHVRQTLEKPASDDRHHE